MDSSQKLPDTTLAFLVTQTQNKPLGPANITSICLALKKRGFGAGRWNGAGGKLQAGETIEMATKREVTEEIGVEIETMYKVAELSFFFPHNPSFDQLVHVYFSEEWQGDMKESEEMRPAWFPVSDIPYDKMWPDDRFWLPQVLLGNKVQARFVFNQDESIKEKRVRLLAETAFFDRL